MPDIGVCCRKEVLEHKKKDGKESDDRYCYWTSPNRANIIDGRKFWVASEGRWQGYFVIKRAFIMVEGMEQNYRSSGFSDSANPLADPIETDPISVHDGMELRFYSETWHEVDGGPRKPFQGFTYNVPEPRSKTDRGGE